MVSFRKPATDKDAPAPTAVKAPEMPSAGADRQALERELAASLDPFYHESFLGAWFNVARL
jgi:hypothetical protein